MSLTRRDFITLLGGATAALPLTVRAQQASPPVVAFVSSRSLNDAARYGGAFRKGLSETGIVEGQNATMQYHWLDGQYDRLPSLMTDLVRARVSVITTPSFTSAALAAKAATSMIPIVFGVGEDPVKLGLVASLARPGGNATGINFLNQEVVAKQVSLLRDLLPKAVRIAVLVNPANVAGAEATTRQASEAASALGLQIQVLKARTSREIDAAFATLARERVEALLVAGDGLFVNRRLQFATLATRQGIPSIYSGRDTVDVGGLMSYATDNAEVYRQSGNYVGRILKGAKPTDLPVIQSTRFEFIINLITAGALGLTVPGDLLSNADEVIEWLSGAANSSLDSAARRRLCGRLRRGRSSRRYRSSHSSAAGRPMRPLLPRSARASTKPATSRDRT